jgi:hypothetical protein
VEDKQEGIRLVFNKSQGEEVCGKPVVPSSGHLLQHVERLVESADPVKLRGINKPHRLAIVDYFRESTMQKQHADGGRLDHWAECLIIVDSGPMGEAAKDLMSLVPL